MNPFIILFLVGGIAGIIAGMLRADLGIFFPGFLLIVVANTLLYVIEGKKS